MPKRYPPAFRRKILDLLKAVRSVAGVAAALDVRARRRSTTSASRRAHQSL
jgi:hypothetical protein